MRRYPTLLIRTKKIKIKIQKKKNIFIEYRKMENADHTTSPALPSTISRGTLNDIESKIHYWSNEIKRLQDNNDDSWEVNSAIWDAVERMRHFQRVYFQVKDRVENQLAYQHEMKRRIVLKDKRVSEDWGTYLFITISPDPAKLTTRQDIIRFVSECRAFFRSYVFDVAEFVFEQRGKQEGDYHGVHCHGIVRRCDTPSKIKKEINRRFILSGICGNEKHVNVKTIDRTELNVTRNYLTGTKQGKNSAQGLDKQEKQANDKFFRRDYGIEAVYIEGEGKLLVP